jgi:hypothetical protein
MDSVLVTRKGNIEKTLRKRFGYGVDSFGFERRAVFDYCAKGDNPCGSKYFGISELVTGLSRNILRQGVDHVNSGFTRVRQKMISSVDAT